MDKRRQEGRCFRCGTSGYRIKRYEYHRAGSQRCEIEQKEREKAEYTRNHTHNLY